MSYDLIGQNDIEDVFTGTMWHSDMEVNKHACRCSSCGFAALLCWPPVGLSPKCSQPGSATPPVKIVSCANCCERRPELSGMS